MNQVRKMVLSELSVKSFVTEIRDRRIFGGADTSTDNECATDTCTNQPCSTDPDCIDFSGPGSAGTCCQSEGSK